MELLSSAGGYIVGILGVIFALAVAWMGGRRSGKADSDTQHSHEKAEAAIKEAKESVEIVTETTRKANDVKSETNNLPVGSAADKLRNDWSRD